MHAGLPSGGRGEWWGREAPGPVYLWPGGSGKRDVGSGVKRQCSYAFWPSQGRKGMKEIGSQILIGRFIYKNCKHTHYVYKSLQHSDR